MASLKMYQGLPSHKVNTDIGDVSKNGHTMSQGEAAMNIVNRLMRQTGVSERVGVSDVLNQLEITPIPKGAVIPIANSIAKAAILDGERIKQGIPLVYIWLGAYLLGTKGSKNFVFAVKELAQEQLAGKIDESVGEGTEGE